MFENLKHNHYDYFFYSFNTIVKTMAEQNFCQNCYQKHDCREIYRQLGEAQCPPVTLKIIVAFVLPLVVFIVSLVVFEAIFSKAINTKSLPTALSLLSAFLTTAVCISISKIIKLAA
jgi:hypothetical protein